jgi:hypothetical protein
VALVQVGAAGTQQSKILGGRLAISTNVLAGAQAFTLTNSASRAPHSRIDRRARGFQ